MWGNFLQTLHLYKIYRNIDILSLSEINGYNNNDELYHIDGYVFVQRNRNHGKGRRVAVYLKNDINWSRRFDLENENI